MHTFNKNAFSEAYLNKVSLGDITEDDILFFEVINKYLIDHLVSHYDPDQAKLQENQEIFTFKIPQRRHRTLDFIRTDLLGREPNRWQLIENGYTNHKYQLTNGVLNIIVKKNVTKDTHLLYYTTANEILALQSLGLTKSQALTSKVIETIGLYNLVVEERIVKSNIVTNKTLLKQYIVTHAQHLIRHFQELERCVCDYKHLSPLLYQQRIVSALQGLILKLEIEYDLLLTIIHHQKEGALPAAIKAELEKLKFNNELIEKFLQYDAEFLEKMVKQYEQIISNANTFKNNVKESLDSPQERSNQIQGFLISELHQILDHAQARNDMITANSDDSLFRGRLRDYIIDAEGVITHYIFDQHNPITHEHQSDFRISSNGDKKPIDKLYGENKVLYQSTYHVGRSKEDQEKVLIGITALDEKRKPQNDVSPEKKPEVVKSPGWNNFSTQSKHQKLNRFLAWGLTMVCHAPLGLANIVVTTITGQAPIANLMQNIEDYFTKKFNIQDEFDNNFQRFKDKLGGNNLYTSTLIGRMFHKVLQELTAVIVSAPIMVWDKIIDQGKRLFADFNSGLWGKLYYHFFPASPQQTLQRLLKQQSVLDAHQNRFDEWLEVTRNLNVIQGQKIWEHNITYASPKEHLNPYNPHDLLSALVNATTGFMEFFKDGVMEKHPVTGFIAALAYAFGGAAVLAPELLSGILAKIGFSATQITTIIAACQAIGKPIAKEGMSQAIASGFSLAKIMGVSMNTAAQGFDSALAKIVHEVSKDPALYGVGICVSYGFGNLITNTFQVPLISSYFREEIGTAPALGRIMIGAKLGMLSLEAALPEDEHHPSIIAEFIGDMANNLMIAVRLALSPITLSAQPYKEAAQQLTRGFGIVSNAINKLSIITVQLIVQIPKTLLEVVTTMYVNLAKGLNFLLSSSAKKQSHEVPSLNTLLTLKHAALQIGSKIGLFFRENLSRRAERFYGHAVKDLEEHHPKVTKYDYSQIVQKLKANAEVTINSEVTPESATIVVMHDAPIQPTLPNPKVSLRFSQGAKLQPQQRQEQQYIPPQVLAY